MSSKRNHSAGHKSCKCDKCGVEAVSTPGTQHRRCSGSASESQTIRPKRDKLPSDQRGRWS